MRGVIYWFARNGVVANLLLVVIAAAGLLTVGSLKQEVFPHFSLDTISVAVDYRGAAPEEVEEAICVRVEEAVQDVEGIKKISSRAREGRGSVTIELHAGYEVREILADVKTKIDAIDTFPEDIEKPVISEITSRFQVINVAIAGDADLAMLKRLGERARDELLALPEISQAELLNAPPYEISIEVSEEALRRWGLTFDDIANAVRRHSVDLPGGSVKTELGEVLLRTEGQASSGAEYERLPLLTRPDGTSIVLSDVATVIDGFEDATIAGMLDGRPKVEVQVYRIGDQSAISVAKAVSDYVAQAAPKMPAGITMVTWQDNSLLLEGRINLLVKNALSGLALVFVVLALFLRLRLAFWVTLGIPISFLGAIAVMGVMDQSINMLSLFSFILVLGIVVDDAIVVGENIHATQVRTGKRTSAAVRGTLQVLVPVTFGVLTTMAAFAPMLFVPGVMGKVMVQFPLIILPTLFFSLVESNLILPRHLSHSKPPAPDAAKNAFRRGTDAFFEVFSGAMDWFIRSIYRPVIRTAVQWRYATVSIGLFSVLLTVGLIGSGQVRLVLFPAVDSDNVVAYLTMPQDSPAAVTAAALDHVMDGAVAVRRELTADLGQDQVRHIVSAVGEQPFRRVQGGPLAGGGNFQGEHLGEINLELVGSEDRAVSAEELANRWRSKIGQVPGAVELTITHDLFGAGKAIDLQYSYPDTGQLVEIVELTRTQLAGYPGVFGVTDTYRSGKPEINLALTKEGESLGFTLQSLGKQVRQAFLGEESQRIQRGRDDVRVMVRYPSLDRRSLGSLEGMRVRTPTGDEVPFSTVAIATMGRGAATITRVDRRRAINVQADIDESITTSDIVVEAMEADFLPAMVERYPGLTYSFEGEEVQLAESMDGLFQGFGAALFVMYAMLAIPLKSYIRPFIILSSVPFGMVGAVWGHWLLGLPVSFLSMCGMVALAGVVVNDGLVLASFIKSYRRKSGTLAHAVQLAGEARFRPIILTSLTTAAGVTPLMLETSLQAQFLIPMAVALAAGVLFATAVTLVLMPSLYMIVEDIRNGVRWLLRGESLPPAPAGAAAGD
jgi:multidrug efflux pump subunit AcrB